MQRMKLSGATVSATLLYGAGTWTLTEERAAKVRGAQRRMLRAMMQRKRERKSTTSPDARSEAAQAEEASEEEAESESDEESDATGGRLEDQSGREQEEELEPWHEWVKRVTRLALHEMKRAQVDDWVDAAMERQFQLAGHISRRDDGRWSTTALNWTPEGRRARRHPLKRWEDDINKVLRELGLTVEDGEWRIFAEDRGTWKEWEIQSREFWILARQQRAEERRRKEDAAKDTPKGCLPGHQAP